MPVVKIKNSPIIRGEPVSHLTGDVASGNGTLTVKNITGFAVSQILLIGELGSEGAEIIKTHASSAPSGTTITLASNTVQPHYAGEKVYVVLYDQVEFSTAATVGGSKSVLSTLNLWPDANETTYFDTATSTGYYFARFKNSIDASFSSYSDPMAITGWSSNTVGYMIDRSLRELGVTFSESLTPQDCFGWLNDGIKIIQGKLKRWPEHYSYNAVLGQVTRGTNVVSMPSDAYDRETNKSLISVRVGTHKPLTYLDPVSFDAQMEDVASTQVRTQATSGGTTLEIDNSYDFEDSGTVHVYISGTKYSITYTGVTRSATAGVLTGIPASGTGSISVTIPVDTYVWQNEDEGIPLFFTVRNSNVEFFPLADASEDNANLYGDYAKVATTVDSDGDEIDYQRFDILQDYLTWRMKMKARNNGNLDIQDGYFVQHKEKLNDAIRTLAQNNLFKTRPRINRMLKRGGVRADIQRLDISEQ